VVDRTPASSELAGMATASPDSSRNSKDRRHLVESFEHKLLSQGNTPTFFDNMVRVALRQEQDPRVAPATRREAGQVCDLFEQLLESKRHRFCSYAERTNQLCPLTGTKRCVLPNDLLMSQGTHSLVKWKQHDVFKTVYDFVIYWMIMDEIKPDVIVELGSGPGGSAIWFADIASALGLKTHVYSYDIKKPDISYPNVTFIEYDLEGISSTNPLPFKERFTGTILVSEDAHVNVRNVLLEVDSFLSSGDYLIVEDSAVKQKDISEFLAATNKDYRVDRYYLDFFGVNGSSSIDSIFKVF
jgi:cephalosporin hydroxylase